MDYSKYLPHIDVNCGTARVMNNINLYKTLLKKFKGREMTDELLEAIKAGDSKKVIHVSHALQGTAGNLSLPALQKITSEIETIAKSGNDYSHLAQELDDTMNELYKNIDEFTDYP